MSYGDRTDCVACCTPTIYSSAERMADRHGWTTELCITKVYIIYVRLYTQSKLYMPSSTLYEVQRSEIRCMQFKPESSTSHRRGDQSYGQIPHIGSHPPPPPLPRLKYLCMIPVTSQKIRRAPHSPHQY